MGATKDMTGIADMDVSTGGGSCLERLSTGMPGIDLSPMSQRAAIICDAVPHFLATSVDIPEMGQVAKQMVTATVLDDGTSRDMLILLWLLSVRLMSVPREARSYWVTGLRTPLDELCGYPGLPCSSINIDDVDACTNTVLDALVELEDMERTTFPLLLDEVRKTVLALMSDATGTYRVMATLMAKRIADTSPDGIARARRLDREIATWREDV